VKGFTQGFKQNNITGLQYSTYVTKKLSNLGYDVTGDIVDFSKYGVPQKRCRFILVGIQKQFSQRLKANSEDFFVRLKSNKVKFLTKKKLKVNVSLEDAISDLLRKNGEVESPDTKNFKAGIYSKPKSKYQIYLRSGKNAGDIADSHRFARHNPHIKKRFTTILKKFNKNRSLNRNDRALLGLKKHTTIPLSKKHPSPTLTTLPDDCIHYEEPRILTAREYARIQTFPDNFEFKGKYTTGGLNRTKEAPRYTQIGNAIPPLFGEQCGFIIRKMLLRKRNIVRRSRKKKIR
jgi:DNA (cytosine-5)-methyltransferase 1